MEVASLGASEAGGGVLGVTAEVYYARGREANPYVKKEMRVKSASDRLMELIDLPDAVIAVGNSPGTMIEIMTLWDYMKKGFLRKKPVLLIGDDWKTQTEAFSEQPKLADW